MSSASVCIFIALILIIFVGSLKHNHLAINASERGQEGQYTFMTRWGSLGAASGQFKGPEGIGIDALNHIYVVDQGNDRIEKFDSNGTFITGLGSRGIANGQFSHPEGITVDSAGHIYVSDFGNNNVQVFVKY